MEPASFDLDLGDPARVGESMGDLWTESQSPILAELVDKILALAPRYADVNESEDVSPLVYVMF